MKRLFIFIAIIFSLSSLSLLLTLSQTRRVTAQAHWILYEANNSIYRIALDGKDQRNLTPNVAFNELCAVSSDGKWLYFNNTRDGEIYRMRSGGGQPENLTDSIGWDRFMAFSPDWQWLYFERQLVSHLDIYRMRPDGGQVEQVTFSDGGAAFQSISPDGAWLIFEQGGDIFRQSVDPQAEPENLTHNIGLDQFETWTPDGAWIIYRFEDNRTSTLIQMRVDGTEKQAITPRDGWYEFRSWSPDQQWMVYFKSQQTERSIYRRSLANGTDQQLITFNARMDYGAWSPDSDIILFNVANIYSKFDVVRWNPDSRFTQRLTPSSSWDLRPTFSPNGAWVVFLSDRRGEWMLYKMRPDGTEQTKITPDKHAETLRGWMPPIDLPLGTHILALLNSTLLIGAVVFLRRVNLT